MSTINVDNVLPQFAASPIINVNGARISTNSGNVIQITTGGTAKTVTNSVIIGQNSGLNLQTGTFNNTLIGSSSGVNITSGTQNTIIGGLSGGQIQTASYNTFLGSGSGSQSTQEGNTFLGWNAGSTAITAQNSTCIGANSQPSASNAYSEFTLGNNNILTLRCAVTSITSLSDARDKKEIEELPVGLEFVKGLKPVKFIWDDRNEEGKHDVADFGFIAQDLKASQEEVEMADTLKLVYESNPEKLEASYGKLIPILVKAIQDLNAKVELLENK